MWSRYLKWRASLKGQVPCLGRASAVLLVLRALQCFDNVALAQTSTTPSLRPLASTTVRVSRPEWSLYWRERSTSPRALWSGGSCPETYVVESRLEIFFDLIFFFYPWIIEPNPCYTSFFLSQYYLPCLNRTERPEVHRPKAHPLRTRPRNRW